MKLIQIIYIMQLENKQNTTIWNVYGNKYWMWSYGLDKQTSKQICDNIVFLEYVHCLCIFYHNSAQIYTVQCFQQNQSLTHTQNNDVYTLLYSKQHNTAVYTLLIW